MTLLVHFAYGNEFVIASTDTRRRKHYYHHETGEERVGSARIVDDIHDKGLVLTDKVLFTYGGLVEHGKNIYDRMKAKVQSDADLDDCRVILEEVFEAYIDQHRGTYLEKVWERPESSFQVFLTGFKKNGGTGFLSAGPGEGVEETPDLSEEVPLLYHCFVPTADIDAIQYKLFEPSEIQSADTPLNAFLSHIAKVHGIIAHVEPDYVSSLCLFHVLVRDVEGIHYKFVPYDTTDFQAQLPEKETLLKHYKG